MIQSLNISMDHDKLPVLEQKVTPMQDSFKLKKNFHRRANTSLNNSVSMQLLPIQSAPTQKRIPKLKKKNGAKITLNPVTLGQLLPQVRSLAGASNT